MSRLLRECPATAVPSGQAVTLPAGEEVGVMQTLGGNVTVRTDHGLFRIAGDDASAIEGWSPGAEAAAAPSGEFGEAAVWAALKTCFDPEIPVNIVDLGLVYSMELAALPDGAGHQVNVAMTLTAPGCGMGPAIAEDAKNKVLLVPGVTSADVRITWDPPWNQSMISEEGKMKLGLV